MLKVSPARHQSVWYVLRAGRAAVASVGGLETSEAGQLTVARHPHATPLAGPICGALIARIRAASSAALAPSARVQGHHTVLRAWAPTSMRAGRHERDEIASEHALSGTACGPSNQPQEAAAGPHLTAHAPRSRPR